MDVGSGPPKNLALPQLDGRQSRSEGPVSVYFPEKKPARIEFIEPAQQEKRTKGEYGILDLEPEKCEQQPVFTEAVTNEAMAKLGIIAEELVKICQEEARRVPGTKEVQKQILADMERRRLDAIEQIKEVRAELLAEYARRVVFDRKYRSSRGKLPGEIELEKLKKLQKREIEQIITLELQKKQTQDDELERMDRMAQVVKERELAVLQAHQLESSRRMARENRVLARIAEREAQIAEEKERQEAANRRHEQMEVEKAHQRQVNAARAEQLKQKKLRRLEEERERKKQEDLAKREAQEEEQRQREEKRLRSRQIELDMLRKKHRKLMELQMERMCAARQKEKEELERRISKMAEDDRLAQVRTAQYRRRKEEELKSIRLRNEERIARSRDFVMRLGSEDAEKKAALELRMEQATERWRKLVAERQNRLELAGSEDNEKKIQAKLRVQKAKDLLLERALAFTEKMNENDARFAEVKNRQAQDAMNKAAFAWYKMRIGELNAKRLERKRAYEAAQSIRKMEERGEVASRLLGEKRKDEEQRAHMGRELVLMKERLIAEVGALLRSGGNVDLNVLAEKFNVDIEAIKSRIRSRGKSAARSQSRAE
jgi:hypothetical protein